MKAHARCNVGHGTESVHQRYTIVAERDLSGRARRLSRGGYLFKWLTKLCHTHIASRYTLMRA
jgi:hypothetical protein